MDAVSRQLKKCKKICQNIIRGRVDIIISKVERLKIGVPPKNILYVCKDVSSKNILKEGVSNKGMQVSKS